MSIMDPLTQERLLERFGQVCRERSIPMTIQRRVVFEVLLASNDHPTVEDLFQRVRQHVPGISQATVYRVLELLEDAGFANRIHHSGSASRYDADTLRHVHLLCLKCRRVVDAAGPEVMPPLPDERTNGFEIHACYVVYEGLCPDCRGEE